MFSILGMHKLKDKGTLTKRACHHMRSHAVANADPTRSSLNGTSWSGSADALVAEIWRKTDPAMQRKDSVRIVELMLTASPEWFEDDPKGARLKQLSQGAREFICETFGAENLIAFGIHRDEKTPHVWAFITPIFDGKLRASRWLDGPKKLEKLHTDWAEKMAPFGLVRGAKKSRAQHIDIRTYYSAVNNNEAAQETISREMSRRAVRAQKRAQEAEKKATDAEAREAKSKCIFDALTEIEQESAAKRFAEHAAAAPLPITKKLNPEALKPSPRPFPAIQNHFRP